MKKLLSAVLLAALCGISSAAPRIVIGKTDKAPVIDGKVDAAEWKNAVEITGFSRYTASKYHPSDTVFLLMYDDDNIYLAVKSSWTGGQAYKGLKNGEDKIWRNDTIDARFQSDLKNSDSVYLICGEPGGAQSLMKGSKLKEWDAKIPAKSWTRDSGEIIGGVKSFNRTLWDYEVAIPFKEIEMTTPEDGMEIGFNIMRNYSENSKLASLRWTSWTRPTPGKAFGRPADFGRLVFGGNIPVYKFSQMEDLSGGDIVLKGNILNLSGRSAKVLSTVEVVIPERKKVILDKTETTEVQNKAEKAFSSVGKVYLKRSMDLMLTQKVACDGKILYENSYMFTTLPAFHCELIPLFLQNKLVITANVKKVGGLSNGFKVTASVASKKDGKKIDGIQFAPFNGPKVLKGSTDISGLKPGPCNVCIELTDNGKQVAVQNLELDIPEKPEWLGNKLGISDKVPVPYTPVKSTADSVSVWGRTYKFGKSLFPEQILSQGKNLLCGPMELVAETDRGKIVWRDPKLVCRSSKDTEAVFDFTAQNPQLDLKGTIKAEYDGFIRIDFELTPKGKITVRDLALRYKMADESAYYARAYGAYPGLGYAAYLKKDGTGGEIKQNIWRFSGTGWLWENAFIYYLWTGGDETGLTLAVNSDENFNTAKYVRIVPDGEMSDVTFRIIGKDTVVAKPKKFAVGIQATPVKALPAPEVYHFGYYFPIPEKFWPGMKGLYAAATYAGLQEGTGYPGLSENGKKTARAMYKYGVRVFPDGAYSWVADDLPVHKIYGKELVGSSNFSMSYGGKNTFGYCRKSAFADYLCWIYKKRYEDGARGLYHDGVNLGLCDSEFHNCGYVDENGKRGKTNGIFEVRETFKRIYTMHKELSPDFFTFVHNSPVTPIGGFADGCCEGESWTEDYSNLTTHQFRAGFAVYNRMGPAFNLYTFVSYNWRYNDLKAVTKTWELIPICLSYNMYPVFSGIGSNAECIGYCGLVPVWEIMDEWFTTAKLYRFWDKNHPVSVSTPDLKATVYLKKDEGRALVLIANIDRKSVKGTFSVDTEKLFGGKAACEIREIFPGEFVYSKTAGFQTVRKKEYRKMTESPSDKIKAEFPQRGIRYFEVSKKK